MHRRPFSVAILLFVTYFSLNSALANATAVAKVVISPNPAPSGSEVLIIVGLLQSEWVIFGHFRSLGACK